MKALVSDSRAGTNEEGTLIVDGYLLFEGGRLAPIVVGLDAQRTSAH
jgi:hypothetical protein